MRIRQLFSTPPDVLLKSQYLALNGLAVQPLLRAAISRKIYLRVFLIVFTQYPSLSDFSNPKGMLFKQFGRANISFGK
jgi:hypothetical protein